MSLTVMVGSVTWEDLCQLSISLAWTTLPEEKEEMRKDLFWLDSTDLQGEWVWDAGKATKDFEGNCGEVWLGFSQAESRKFSWCGSLLEARKCEDGSWELRYEWKTISRKDNNFPFVGRFLATVQPETVRFQETGYVRGLQNAVEKFLEGTKCPDKVNRVRAAMSVLRFDIELEREFSAASAFMTLHDLRS